MKKMRPDLEDVLSTLLRIFLIDISATPHALALIRLTNAASLFLPVLPTPLRGYCFAVRQNERQLPYGSGKTQGVLLLRRQAERKAASASHSGEMKGEGAPLHFHMPNQA